MKTQGVSTSIVSTIQAGVAKHLSDISKRSFDGANIQLIEKKFYKTIGEAGAYGLNELFIRNDKKDHAILYDGQKHYRKYITTGRYLTLLGEISLKRGIYQSNKSNQSICPLEQKLKFINDYVSFAAAEYICYSLATMTLSEFIKYCRKWALMKPSDGTVRKVLDYVGQFLEKSDFLTDIQSEEKVSSNAVTLAMSIDATSVNIRKEGWRHAAAATVSTYDIEGNRLDTVYIGRMPETGKKLIKLLLENEIQNKMSKHKFKNIVCIADGARELWRFFRSKYPDTIHVVDFFHVCEHLSKLSGLLFKDSA